MDTQRSKMTELLNEQTDGFRIDTKLPQEVRDTIRSANLVGKSLNAVDWSALPRSADSIFIQIHANARRRRKRWRRERERRG